MKRSRVLLPLLAGGLLIWPLTAPAPLIYTPGEGWSYERVGAAGKWQRTRAKDQLDVAQAAFNQKDYGLALKAAQRVVHQWPLSDYAPAAQYLVGRCYEAKRQDEKAFNHYQKLLQKYPKVDNYEEVLRRQYQIATRFLGGQWFKVWGYIPFFPSMEKTAEMYSKIVKDGPFSQVAPHAQLRIGAAREKQHNYPLAVKAYEAAADRYHDRPTIAADAVFRTGMSHYKQAKKAEYDQSAAGQAIAAFTDFQTLFPKDRRTSQAEKIIRDLRREQARGDFEIARFYEKKKRWRGAQVYYNEVRLKDPTSPYAVEALKRIEAIQQRVLGTSK